MAYGKMIFHGIELVIFHRNLGGDPGLLGYITLHNQHHESWASINVWRFPNIGLPLSHPEGTGK